MIYIIEDYERLMMNISDIIKMAGYRTDYICQKIEMPKPTFYAKKKKHSFTLNEMRRIFSIINTEEIEDKILAKMIESTKNDEMLTEEETRLAFQ